VIIPLSIDADMHGRKGRFAILLVSIAIYLSILLIRRSNLSRMAVAFFLSLALILPLKALVVSYAVNLTTIGNDATLLLLPPSVAAPGANDVVNKRLNDLEYKQILKGYPDGQCWAAELPCTPLLFREDIKLRNPGRGIAAGLIRAAR